MNCDDARQLLDRGIEPGSATPKRRDLGFHLAGCAGCRAYHAAAQAQLLGQLLSAPVAARPIAAAAAPPPPPAPKARRWRWPLAILGVALLAVVLAALAPAALALYTIRQNVRSYIQPTAQPASVGTSTPQTTASALAVAQPPTPIPSPAPASPSAAAAPSATLVLAEAPTGTPATTPEAQATAEVTARPLSTRTPTPVPLGEVIGQPAPQTQPQGAAQAAAPPQQTQLQPNLAPVSGSGITVLLLGVDRRPDEVGPSRSDAIAIARLEPDRKRVALLSLPRDLMVDIPGYGTARINAAHVYGELYPELGGGPALARATVSTLLGVPIDYVAIIDFQGFIGAINAIGGVTVNVEQELYDPQYPTLDYGYTVAHFLPGEQTMDGERALMYSRIRHPDSDYERMKRQQAVMVAVLARVRGQNALEQLQSIAAITTAMRGFVQTDMPEDRMIDLALAFHDTDPTSVERFTLDGSQVATNVLPGDPYAQFALPGAIESLVARLLGR